VKINFKLLALSVIYCIDLLHLILFPKNNSTHVNGFESKLCIQIYIKLNCMGNNCFIFIFKNY